MATYPYYSESAHTQGTVSIASGNAARTTSTTSTEERLIVDAQEKIMLLEPRLNWALL